MYKQNKCCSLALARNAKQSLTNLNNTHSRSDILLVAVSGFKVLINAQTRIQIPVITLQTSENKKERK